MLYVSQRQANLTHANQPNKDNIVKLAIHDSGYTHFPGAGQADISTPRTITSHQSDGLRIPKQKVQELREHLRRFYPELADKPFASTRLCWLVSFIIITSKVIW